MSAGPDPAKARRQRWFRLAFLALLGGGLLVIARRRPRDLPLELDLSAARPAALQEVDVVVRREGAALLRVEQRFGAAGAPDLLRLVVRGKPGPVEVEVTLVGDAGARRTREPATLDEEGPARVSLR